MNKEFQLLTGSYIGSIIEERADNDGDNLRKEVALGVQDNNIYIINPVTGLLESNIKNVSDDTPDSAQLTLTNPTSSLSVFVIKNIGKTLKVTNVSKTENCINQKVSGSNYIYDGISFPSGSKDCHKNIYFTSDKGIIWPRQQETQTVLDDLSKKIPYDIGFSKKYYKIHHLDENHLMKIQNDTRISSEFLKKLPVLFLFDTEYTDEIEYSSIKLSPEWDGYTIDDNDRNNLVYSDYFKTGSADYANFVFLVNDKMLQEIEEYFNVVSNQKISVTDRTTFFNPLEWIVEKNKPKEKYGKLTSFELELNDTTLSLFEKEKSILEKIITEELYKIDPYVSDIELVEDTIASDFFKEIVDTNNNAFNIKNLIDWFSTNDENPDIEQETNFYGERANNLFNHLRLSFEKVVLTQRNINIKLIKLLIKYFSFQITNELPTYNEIIFNYDTFDTLIHNESFILNNSELAERDFNFIITINDENIITIIYQEVGTEQVNDLLDTESIQNVTEVTNFTTIENEILNTNFFIYKQLSENIDSIFQSENYHKTNPLFDNNSDRCNLFFTASAIENHKKYYTKVYTKNNYEQKNVDVFNISYAHKDGLGSSFVKNDIELYPAKVMYKKYMADCFGNADVLTFKNGKTSEYFYVIEFNKQYFKDRLDNTTFQISICPLSSSKNQLINTGSNYTVDQTSNKIFTLIDDSRITKTYNDITYDINEYYSLVEGTIPQGLSEDDNYDIWGLIFPNKGLVLLDGKTLDYSCSFNTVTASIDGDNINKLFTSISGSCSPNNVRENFEYWYVRSAEVYSDLNYYCRARLNEFNYTNNYTYITGSDRQFYYDTLNASTKTYITTIGLYNNSKELLAVAKLSKPVIKDNFSEYIFNIKIRTS